MPHYVLVYYCIILLFNYNDSHRYVAATTSVATKTVATKSVATKSVGTV